MKRLAIMYKINNGLVKMGIESFNLRRSHPLRHVNIRGFEILVSRTNYHMMSFLLKNIRGWNRLLDAVVWAATLEALWAKLAC